MAKTLIAILVAVLILPLSASAQTTPSTSSPPVLKGQCPAPKIVGDVEACLKCHVMAESKFRLKEFAPDAFLDYPSGAKIKDSVGYYTLEAIDSERFEKALTYLKQHGMKRIVVQIYSPGGSMMGAWKIIGLMREAQAEGIVIETRVYGLAASAGFLIFASGTKGYRLATPTAELMWHELLSFKLFDISGPSLKEYEAKVLRHLQDNANNFIASVSNLSKGKIDELIRNKEFWMNGAEAYKNGIADKLIGGEVSETK